MKPDEAAPEEHQVFNRWMLFCFFSIACGTLIVIAIKAVASNQLMAKMSDMLALGFMCAISGLLLALFGPPTPIVNLFRRFRTTTDRT